MEVISDHYQSRSLQSSFREPRSISVVIQRHVFLVTLPCGWLMSKGNEVEGVSRVIRAREGGVVQ